jgi:outer membrane immunogenic protein
MQTSFLGDAAMKKLALGMTLLAIGAVDAVAADLPVKAPIAPPLVFTWTGCYVGGSAGWIGSDGRYDLRPAGSYLNAPGGLAPPNAAGTGDFLTNVAALSHSYSPRDNGGLVGVQAGCNQQAGSFVFGVEGDWSWTSLRSTNNAAFAAFANVGNPTFTNADHIEHVSTRLDWLATFRGRAGWAWDRLYLYATGGLAVGDVRSDTAVTFGTFPVNPVYNGAIHIGSGSSWQVGWTAGAGAEYAFSPQWSVKAEYLYVDLGTFSYFSPLVAATAPAVVGPGYGWRTTVTERDHIVRVGLNYKFGPTPVVAKY